VEIQILCIERDPRGRIIRISQTGGPLISLTRMKELVMKGEDTYFIMKGNQKLKVYAANGYPFLTINLDNPKGNDLDFISSCSRGS
jgi:hypothetical protein